MPKKYEIDGQEFYFNFSKFNDLFRQNMRSIEDKEQELSDYIHAPKSTIHSWRNYEKSPSEIAVIKSLSKYFKLKNYKDLLTTKEKMSEINDIKINSIKRIYDAIIEYLDYFYNTDGYNDLWECFENNGVNKEDIEDKLYAGAIEELEEVILCYKKERMILKNTEIYDELGKFIYNDLNEIFDGKLEYAYRFEANFNDNPTTTDDYNKASNKLDEIIDKYIN